MTSPRRRAARRVATLALALALPAVAASPAAAGTLTFAGGKLTYTAAAGEYNSVDISYSSYANEVSIDDDGAPIVLGAGATGCTRNTYASAPDRTAECVLTGWTSLAVDAGDKDDYLSYGTGLPAMPKTTTLGAGDDVLHDHPGGNSTITGGDGFDSISTYGGGSDRLDGNAGDDSIYSNAGADTINGGLGSDSLRVNNGAEQISTVHGNEGDDSLSSSTGNDRLYGDADEDKLEGGQGTDLLDGGDGDDVLDGDHSARPLPDTLIGGTGSDTVDYSDRLSPGQEVNVSLDGVANDGMSGEADWVQSSVESIRGGYQADVLTGNGAANVIEGNGGDDVITGGAASDTLDGGGGKDLVSGGTGDDSVNGSSDYDTLDGGDGDDDVFGGSGDDDLFGADGADKLRAEEGFDTVEGGPGLDNIDAGPDNDTIWSRDDLQDQVWCGGGADLAYIDHLDVGATTSCPLAKVAPGAAIDREGSRINYTAGPGANNTMSVSQAGTVLTFREANTAVTLTAGTGCTRVTAQQVTCSVATPVLSLVLDGDSGNDQLQQTAAIPTRFVGGPGDDRIFDSPAADLMWGNDGTDTFTQTVAVSADVLSGGDGRDAVTYAARTGAVAVSLDASRNDGQDANGDTSGEEGDFVRTDVEDVTGGSAADWLRGSGVGNTLNGGAGADLLGGGLGRDTLNGQAGADLINSRDGNPDTIACGTEGGTLTMDATGDTQTGCTLAP